MTKRHTQYAGVVESCVQEFSTRACRLAGGDNKLARDCLLLWAADNQTLRDGLVRRGANSAIAEAREQKICRQTGLPQHEVERILKATGGAYAVHHPDAGDPD